MDGPSPTESDAVREKAEGARAAARILAASGDVERKAAVRGLADAVWQRRAEILAESAKDVAAAKASDLARPLLDRLALSEEKLRQLVDGVRHVADGADPLGRTLRATRLDDGLELFQVSVPIGVVAVVFESRPDALVQIAALTLRSGNAALLKGGREAEGCNRLLASIVRDAAAQAGLPADSVQLLSDRAEVDAVLALDDLVDLVVPRGSSAFVRHILDHSRIPVLGHAEGVCHVHVDAAADLDKALAVVLDAKADYPSACNAAETVLIDAGIAELFLPRLRASAQERGITLLDSPESYGQEFGDLRLAVRVVESLDEAIAHVNRYGTRHTDAIVTEDRDAARRFVAGVDTASVLVNASTRFADGYRFGLGAELGIATGKLHARGPVGVEGLTTTKWVVLGSGQRAGDYQGAKAKPFLHVPLDKRLEDAL